MHFTEERSNTAESSVSTLLRKKKQFKAMSQIENPAFLFTSIESCFNRFVDPNSIVKLTAFLFLPQHTEAADSCSKQGDLIFLITEHENTCDKRISNVFVCREIPTTIAVGIY